MRDLDGHIVEETLSAEQIKEAFSKMYPPGMLFSEDIQTVPEIYPAWFKNEGCNLTPHSSRIIMKTLASNIYTEAEEANAAMQMVTAVIALNRAKVSSAAIAAQ